MSNEEPKCEEEFETSEKEFEKSAGKLVSKYKCYKYYARQNKPVTSDSIRSGGNFSDLFAITIDYFTWQLHDSKQCYPSFQA